MNIDITKIASMTWMSVPIIIYDLETTGFSKEDKIVEFGAVLMEGNRVVDTMHHIINPGRPIPPETTKVHNITDSMVASAPRWRDVARECYNFLFRGYPIVAHNFGFDSRMLAQQVDPRQWPRNIFTLCTMVEARKMGHKGRAKLTELAEHYNLEYETEHAALDDAIVTGRLARRFAGAQIVSNYYTKTTGEWADSYIK